MRSRKFKDENNYLKSYLKKFFDSKLREFYAIAAFMIYLDVGERFYKANGEGLINNIWVFNKKAQYF